MKNKSDAPKSERARKGKDAEFKPFWSDNQPKKAEAKPSGKTDQPRTPRAKPSASKGEKSPSASPAAPAFTKAAPGVKGGAMKMEPSRARAGKPGTAAEKSTDKPAVQSSATQRSTVRKPAANAGGATSQPGAGVRKPHPGAAHGKDAAHGKGAAHGKDAAERSTLRSGLTVELNITATNNDGFGVAMHEGHRVLVAGALPTEQLVARVTYVGRREAFANTIKCLKCSPDRQPSPACHMGRCCDGCGLMQMRYPVQLAWKKNLVTRELYKFPSLGEAQIHDTLGSPKELNYRNSAKLVVAGKCADPVIGIYRRNTHDVLEIGECPLHHPLINKVVKAAKAGIKKGKVPIYNPKSEMGLLRYLVIRVAEPSDKVMVVFVTSEQGYNEIHHLAKFVQQAVPEVVVVAQNINNSTGNVIFGHKDRFITKMQTLRAHLGNKTFSLSPHSFYQVNSGAARIIYEKVRELAALKGSERVIDLYCGIGGISLFLADSAREVVGIEFVEAAVADATHNATLNGADNCSFEAGDVAHLLDEIGEDGGADLIVLNPPRKGCEEKVLKSVVGIKPARIIYVSCSPETLSRDLDMLSRMGYRTLQVQPVDMFPQTVHVENVALLERVEA